MTMISLSDVSRAEKLKKQAGAELGQAQLKVELELCFTSFKICFIKLIKLVRLYKLSAPTLLIIPSKSVLKWPKLLQLATALLGDLLVAS